MHEIEVWVVMDANGDYGMGRDQDGAESDYDENVGGSDCRRALCIKLKVPAPKPLVLTGEAPEESEKGAMLSVE